MSQQTINVSNGLLLTSARETSSDLVIGQSSYVIDVLLESLKLSRWRSEFCDKPNIRRFDEAKYIEQVIIWVATIAP